MSGPWIAAFLMLWALMLLIALLVLGLLRRVNSVLEGAEAKVTSALTGPGAGGVPPGTRLPAFEGSRGGQPVSSADLLREPAVFVFMESGCQPCVELARRLSHVDGRLDGVPLHVVFEDTPAAREFPIPPSVPVLYQRAGAISEAFDTRATPHAFAVDAGGVVVANKIPGRLDDLHELAALCRKTDTDEAAEQEVRRPRPRSGTAPGRRGGEAFGHSRRGPT